MFSSEALYLVLLILCLLLSSFFSSSETAFVSLQKIRLEHLVNTRVKGARRIAKMLERPEKLLSTILLGNTFVNTAAAAPLNFNSETSNDESTNALQKKVLEAQSQWESNTWRILRNTPQDACHQLATSLIRYLSLKDACISWVLWFG